jgi:4-hydroxybenzoate polyprenyltransferase
MSEVLIVLALVLGIWITVGWIMIFGGYYPIETSYREPFYKNWLVAPAIFMGWVIVIVIYKGFELLDWIVYTYYRLTNYTKNYMKKRR